MKKWIAMLALALFAFAAAAEGGMTAAELTSCAFSRFGGMENESLEMTMSRSPSGGATLTIEDQDGRDALPLAESDLQALDELLRSYAPDAWASLPEKEFFALDAPSERIKLRYADGTEYSVYSDKDTGGPLFYEVRCFLGSYAAGDAETFSLPLSASGDGSDLRPVISRPAMLRAEEVARDGGEVLVFHGRIPGEVELRIGASGPSAPIDGAQTVYLLKIDSQYNVRLLETRTEAG